MKATQEEQWRPIPGTDGRYDVSDRGRVRSWIPHGRAPRVVPHLIKPHMARGYPRVCITAEPGRQTSANIHRLIMLAFEGPCPEGMEVRHLDGDPLNSTLTNLAYGTKSENGMDAVRHGTHGMTRKTHCPHGHPYDEANTYIRPGRRGCRTCLTRRNRARFDRHLEDEQ